MVVILVIVIAFYSSMLPDLIMVLRASGSWGTSRSHSQYNMMVHACPCVYSCLCLPLLYSQPGMQCTSADILLRTVFPLAL